ncbi:MAG: hypothetical protein ACPG9K_01005 [Poseidonibacter sp.]
MIPIYRAKKIDSDEYVFGVPRQDSKGFYEMIINTCEDGVCGVIQRYIDSTTLSIHFPDMLDSQGNKIFASLQEDGKGGDIFIWENETFIAWFDNIALTVNATNKDNFECSCHDSLHEWYEGSIEKYNIKVIGIQND